MFFPVQQFITTKGIILAIYVFIFLSSHYLCINPVDRIYDKENDAFCVPDLTCLMKKSFRFPK